MLKLVSQLVQIRREPDFRLVLEVVEHDLKCDEHVLVFDALWALELNLLHLANGSRFGNLFGSLVARFALDSDRFAESLSTNF